AQLALLQPIPSGVHQPGSGADADVSGEEDLLQLGEHAVVHHRCAGEEPVEPGHEALAPRALEARGERPPRLRLGTCPGLLLEAPALRLLGFASALLLFLAEPPGLRLLAGATLARLRLGGLLRPVLLPLGLLLAVLERPGLGLQPRPLGRFGLG